LFLDGQREECVVNLQPWRQLQQLP
jgi:hypothetical protein